LLLLCAGAQCLSGKAHASGGETEEEVAFSASSVQANISGPVEVELRRFYLTSGNIKAMSKTARILPERYLLELHGDVQIEFEGLILKADHGTVDLGQKKIFARHLHLETDLRLRDPLVVDAESAACTQCGCELDDVAAVVCRCPGSNDGWSIHASHAALDEDGDLDLTWPVLHVNEVPVFGLPWIMLRTGREPGLLAPRLGYSEPAGFIVGPAAWFPLGDEAGLTLDAAARTKRGAEAGAKIENGTDVLEGRYIYDDGENRGIVQGEGGTSLQSAEAAGSINIETDGMLLREMAMSMDEAARTKMDNSLRIAAGTGAFWIETDANAVGLAGVENPWPYGVGQRPVRIRAEVGPEPVPHSPFLASIGMSMSRFSSLAGDYMIMGPAYSFPPVTRITLTPGLEAGGRAGPFVLRASAGTIHASYLVDDTPSGDDYDESMHLLRMGMEIELPLEKKLSQGVHTITPALRLRSAPWVHGKSAFPMDDMDRATQSLRAEGGLVQRYEDFDKSMDAQLELFQSVLWTGIEDVEPFFRMDLSIETGRCTTGASAAFSEREKSLNEAEIDIRFTGWHEITTQVRYLYLDYGPGMSTLGRIDSAEYFAALYLFPDSRVHYAGTDLGVPIVYGLRALGEFHAGLSQEVVYGYGYGLSWGPGCGCGELSLRAFHRFGRSEPDVWMTVALSGF